MRLMRVGLLLAIVALGVVAGLAKAMEAPGEVALFGRAGVMPEVLALFGAAQLVSALAMLWPPMRASAAVILASCFAYTAWVTWNFGAPLVSPAHAAVGAGALVAGFWRLRRPEP